MPARAFLGGCGATRRLHRQRLGRVREAVSHDEAPHDVDVAQALGIGLELVPGVEQADCKRCAVARLEVGVFHGCQSRSGQMLGGVTQLTATTRAC